MVGEILSGPKACSSIRILPVLLGLVVIGFLDCLDSETSFVGGTSNCYLND